MTTKNDIQGPVRTCIGCRRRVAKRELLRIVVGTQTRDTGTAQVAVPDPNGTAPGRGAHLHPTAACLELAERRRAFTRALRYDAGAGGALDLAPLRLHLRERPMSTDKETGA